MTRGDRPVLVTGGCYFLGTHVARRLAERGRAVRCLSSRGAPPPAVRSFVGPGVEWGEASVHDRSRLEEAMRGCGTVYHCDEDYRTWAPRPEAIYRHNVDGTATVLEAATRAGVERIVYTSSVGALGRTRGGEPADESTPVDLDQMVGHYQRSKFLAERTVEEWVDRGAPVVTVNPPASVGEVDREPTPVGGLIVDFMAGRVPAYMESGRNFIDVRDVAEGHLLAAAEGAVGERYVLAAHNLTVGEFLDRLAEVSGRPAPRWKLPQWVALAYAAGQELRWKLTGREPEVSVESVRAARQKMFFTASKARRSLGFAPGPLEPALRRATRWFRDQGYLDRERS